MCNQTGDGAGGQSEPDLTFVPAQISQIKSDESAKPGLNIGKKEIQPVEALAALL